MSNLVSFKSKHFPKSSNPVTVLQENAIRFYAMFNIVVLIGVMIRLQSNLPVFWFAVIGVILSIAFGNFAAYINLKNRVAEIFFVGESFSMISVYEIIRKVPSKSFPLKFANPVRTENEIQIHYRDQVMVLKRDDWEEFDLIWNWLSQRSAT